MLHNALVNVLNGRLELELWPSSVARSLGRSLAHSVARSVARSNARLVGRSIARALVRSLDRAITRSLVRSIARYHRECRTWVILRLWASSLSNLRSIGVEPWAILDLRMSNLSNLISAYLYLFLFIFACAGLYRLSYFVCFLISLYDRGAFHISARLR